MTKVRINSGACGYTAQAKKKNKSVKQPKETAALRLPSTVTIWNATNNF